MIMRTNDMQKINELKNILQEIVDKSYTIADYDIEALKTETGELLVNVTLSNDDGVVVREFEGTYFEVLYTAKLVLYPLI